MVNIAFDNEIALTVLFIDLNNYKQVVKLGLCYRMSY